jgi:hypothetical protein
VLLFAPTLKWRQINATVLFFPHWKLVTLQSSNKAYQYNETNVMHFLFSFIKSSNPGAANWHNNIPSATFSASWGWASNARNVYRPLILNKLNKNYITLVSRYWYTVMHGQQNILHIVPAADVIATASMGKTAIVLLSFHKMCLSVFHSLG